MAWQDTFLMNLSPGILSGVTFEDWLLLLSKNGYAVHPKYALRALAITWLSVINSLMERRERAHFSRQIAEAVVQPPLFILGMWRSGTTHLHNLLALDERFAYPNYFQMMFPHSFLLTERDWTKFVDFFTPPTRPLDDMALAAEAPFEDEFALCTLSQRSFLLSYVFPRCADDYFRFLTFRRADEDDKRAWREACLWLMRKLSLRYDRPLVLKSPGHSCRIGMLLEMFPEARFVHIHRHPCRVFQSSRESAKRMVQYFSLQQVEWSRLEEQVYEHHSEFYEAFFDERDLIPTTHYHELSFDDLEQNPLEQMRRLYAALSLPDFSEVEPQLRRYLASLRGYQKNRLPELEAGEKERIAATWPRCFSEWGYAI